MVQREFRLCEVERLQDIWISDMREDMKFFNEKDQYMYISLFLDAFDRYSHHV